MAVVHTTASDPELTFAHCESGHTRQRGTFQRSGRLGANLKCGLTVRDEWRSVGWLVWNVRILLPSLAIAAIPQRFGE